MFSKEFDEIVNFRRSNRKFDPNIEVPNDVLQKSIERAVLSPNSSNMQLWEFHWIQSKEMLETFVPLCLGQSATNCTTNGGFRYPQRQMEKSCEVELGHG